MVRFSGFSDLKGIFVAPTVFFPGVTEFGNQKNTLQGTNSHIASPGKPEKSSTAQIAFLVGDSSDSFQPEGFVPKTSFRMRRMNRSDDKRLMLKGN